MRCFAQLLLVNCLIAWTAVAQHGGGGRGGGGFHGGMGGRFRGGLGGFRGGIGGGIHRGFGRFGRINQHFIDNRFFLGGGLAYYGWGFPAYYADYGTPYADVSQSEPSVIMLPVLPPAPEPPPPPPPPVTPVMHEYQWPDANQDDTATVFSIVTNDHKVHYATMVWSDGNLLRFTTRDGTTDQVLRSSISRDLTYQANAGKNLRAWLP